MSAVAQRTSYSTLVTSLMIFEPLVTCYRETEAYYESLSFSIAAMAAVFIDEAW